jgi:hypothetical protein
MYGIFRVDSNLQVILSKDAAMLCPELTKISEDELKYIILAYDYLESPFRKKPPEERKRIAKRKVFGNSKKNIEASSEMKKAIEAYRSLIYDPRKEATDNYRQKIHTLNMEIAHINDYKEIKEKANIIEFLQKKIDDYENEIVSEEVNMEIKLKGNKELSYLEIWQRRKQAFEKDQRLLGDNVE